MPTQEDSARGVRLPILGEMIQGDLPYGSNHIVEFDPDSSWYETSLSITSQALKRGIRVEYHTFMHLPREIRHGLSKRGLDEAQLTGEQRFRIWDSYTPLTGLSLPQEPKVGISGK